MLQIVAGHVDKDGTSLSDTGMSSDSCPTSGAFASVKVSGMDGRYQLRFPGGTFSEEPTVAVTLANENLTASDTKQGNSRMPTVAYLAEDDDGCWTCTVSIKNRSGDNKDSAFFFTAVGHSGDTSTITTYVVWDDTDDTISLVDDSGSTLTTIDCTNKMTMKFVAAELDGNGEPQESTSFHITGILGLPWKVFGFPKVAKTSDDSDAAYEWSFFNNCYETNNYGFVISAVKGNLAACTTDPQIANEVG